MGGRPLPVSIVRDAASSGVAVDALIGELRAERFVRSGFRDGHEVIEPTHDRIRETIVASLSPAALRERHRQLGRALESMPGADLEALSAHLLGAGEKERAAAYAEQAAEQAVSKLAFEQAVRLFRATLRIIGPEAADMRRLSTRLASVLEWSGRGGEAALVYLDAARGAPVGRAAGARTRGRRAAPRVREHRRGRARPARRSRVDGHGRADARRLGGAGLAPRVPGVAPPRRTALPGSHARRGQPRRPRPGGRALLDRPRA